MKRIMYIGEESGYRIFAVEDDVVHWLMVTFGGNVKAIVNVPYRSIFGNDVLQRWVYVTDEQELMLRLKFQ